MSMMLLAIVVIASLLLFPVWAIVAHQIQKASRGEISKEALKTYTDQAIAKIRKHRSEK